jgi:GH15 family glucan-1,4-alpha-glucosidase
MDTSGSNIIQQDLYENRPQEKPTTAETQSRVGQTVPTVPTNVHNLNLRLIGNSAFNALVDERGSITWSCMPRFDADPVFCSLLRKNKDIGFFDIELQHFERSEQEYVKNTAILKTTLYDKFGNTLEMIDFCPLHQSAGRSYRPTMLMRILNATGRPRIRVRLRPTFGYGWGVPEKTRGSNHIRYLVPTGTLRLTSNAPISYLLREVAFEVDGPIFLILMPDESLSVGIEEFAISTLEKTQSYWEEFVSYLAIPFEWQPHVIRACITLKLLTYQETGAIVGAATTSIPREPQAKLQDLRYCRIEDMPHIIRTLNRLGMAPSMSQYLSFISNIVAEFVDNDDSQAGLQSIYGISLETLLHEKEVHRLSGYRGESPVVVGNNEFKEPAIGSYGSIILAMAQCFFDQRLNTPGDDTTLFNRLEKLGQRILQDYKKPAAKGSLNINHTVMCWAGCDRLAKIAANLGSTEKEQFWQQAADEVRGFITKTYWNDKDQHFCSDSNCKQITPQVLLLAEIGFLAADDPQFVGTLNAVEKQLVSKEHPFLLSSPDHKGNCYILYTVWYINALYSVGRVEESRKLFEEVLASCNGCGTVGETIDPKTRELWGNFPHAITTTAIIYTALRLSIPWRNMI